MKMAGSNPGHFVGAVLVIACDRREASVKGSGSEDLSAEAQRAKAEAAMPQQAEKWIASLRSQ
jgi:hypothetical protein